MGGPFAKVAMWPSHLWSQSPKSPVSLDPNAVFGNCYFFPMGENPRGLESFALIPRQKLWKQVVPTHPTWMRWGIGKTEMHDQNKIPPVQKVPRMVGKQPRTGLWPYGYGPILLQGWHSHIFIAPCDLQSFNNPGSKVMFLFLQMKKLEMIKWFTATNHQSKT